MSYAQVSRWLSMSTTFKRSIASKVTERVRSGKCLLCDADAVRRGLCMNHYQTFMRRQKARGPEGGVLFEEACIREGKVLGQHVMRDLKKNDPFADL